MQASDAHKSKVGNTDGTQAPCLLPRQSWSSLRGFCAPAASPLLQVWPALGPENSSRTEADTWGQWKRAPGEDLDFSLPRDAPQPRSSGPSS